MEASAEKRFTANIFFNLLLDAMQNRFILGASQKGCYYTQTDMFACLTYLTDSGITHITGKEKIKCSKYTQNAENLISAFKFGKLKVKAGAVYKFEDQEFIKSFSYQVINNYQFVLCKMIEFVKRYFDADVNSKTNRLLVKRVIKLISADQQIDERDLFYCCSNGTTKTKSEIINSVDIEFEPFLLGVWHYLLKHGLIQTFLDKSIFEDFKEININLRRAENDLVKDKIEIKSSLKERKDIASLQHNAESGFLSLEKSNYSSMRKKLMKKHCITGPEDDHFDEILNDPECYYPIELDESVDFIALLENGSTVISRNIVFYLLQAYIMPSHPSKNKNAVANLFFELLNLTLNNSFKTNEYDILDKREYQKFEIIDSIYSKYGLNDRKLVKSFFDNVDNDYSAVLNEMSKILFKYFKSNELNQSLVVTLLEFIRNDADISDDYEFYISIDGESVTKSMLFDIEEIEFEPFILGVWIYAVSRLDKKYNAEKETFEKIFKVKYKCNGRLYDLCRMRDNIANQSSLFVDLIYM